VRVTQRLTQARFDLYAIGTRLSMATVMSDEISYWADLDENVIGLVFRDTTDDDYGWSVMVRDRLGRFRGARLNVNIKCARRAEAELRLEIAEISRNVDIEELQGDETNSAIDLLTILPGTKVEELHPYFIALLENPGRAPARAVLKEIGPWLTAADPHFVKEFQRHQFDQRLWELYIWAALREGGYDVEHVEAPDFLVSSPFVRFTVEATTIAPSQGGILANHPNPKTPEEIKEFLTGYMPIKYGNSLTNKLKRRSALGKHYWEEESAKGLPFIIAVADFHKPADDDGLGPMTFTQSAIWPYLYGRSFEAEIVNGYLQMNSKKIATHSYGDKTIEAGFFYLPDAENVSAVMFSNAGTLAKFDRVGVMAGFAAPDHKYFRIGIRYDPDPNAITGTQFKSEIGKENYDERWADEIQIFHNPSAKTPLPPECFAGLTQHFLVGEDIKTTYGEEAVLSSFTVIVNVGSKRAD
jgi:hypothetical protein